jgi:hypothetical protein
MTLALAMNYDDIVEALAQNGTDMSCDSINVDCYSNLIENLGYYKRHAKDLTVGDIADMFKDKVLIIRTEGHLTCVIDNVCYDTWDCREKIATCFWIIH